MQELSQASSSEQQNNETSAVKIRLLKGPIYRHRHKELWLWLERDQFQIREYFQPIGLSLLLDDAEGYAFLKQRELAEGEDEIELPRLITRRALSFANTLLLVLIRKRLAEHDSEESSPRLIITRSEIHEWLQPYFATTSNEVKQHREFDSLIKKVIEMGFISVLTNHQDEFEVQRIIKAMVSAEQIGDLLEKLQQYTQQEQEE